MSSKTIVENVYDTAAYIRLSKDDADIDGKLKVESNSVSNQRELLRNYIKQQPELQLFDMYVDDGFSGGTFERPEFIRMMEDVKTGKVKAIVCKDLSRFSRDSLEAGEYQMRIFPEMGVRFIAIGDHYDSETATSVERNLVLPVKNIVNESYLRDTSTRIRSQQETKMQAGAFIGSFAVYGYKKNEADHNLIQIDQYPAGIVREIFELKMLGYSMERIASILNERGVASPYEYKKANHANFYSGFKKDAVAMWSANAIRRILTNEIYTGTMVQGKRSTAGYKNPSRKQNADGTEYCCRVENTHEAIISRVDFDTIQSLLQFEGKCSGGDPVKNIYSGVLMCGDCNTPMIRRVYKNKAGDKAVFICKTKNAGKGCSRHAITEKELNKVVLEALQVFVEGYIEYNQVLKRVEKMNVTFDRIIDYDTELKRLQEQYEVVSADLFGFRNDLELGLINQEQYENYTAEFTNKAEEIKSALEKQKYLVQSLLKKGPEMGAKLERMKRALTINELDRKTLVRFVQNIWVYEGDDVRLVIDFKFADELEKLKVIKRCCDENPEQADEWEVITSA